MIRRLYVDGFRSLVDFTWEPGAENLVLGANGSGKTTVLDILDLIRAWTGGWNRLEDLLDADALTRWRVSETLSIHLDLEMNAQEYSYRVEFSCSRADRSSLFGGPRVQRELLSVDGQRVVFRDADVMAGLESHLGDVGTTTLPVPASQSALALSAAQQSEETIAFLGALSRMIIVRPIPSMIKIEARQPELRPSYYFENFIAWYRTQIQSGAFQREMFGGLHSLWPDFDYLRLDQLGRTTFGLSAVFRTTAANPQRSFGEQEFVLDFSEMSEGERMLVVLYTLAAYQRATPPTTLVIDEPDNFVALAELQPWLLKLLDDRPDGGQIVIVSHNPEIIRTMGEETVSYFHRESHTSPTRVSRLAPDDTGLSLPERLARGWIKPEPVGAEPADEARR